MTFLDRVGLALGTGLYLGFVPPRTATLGATLGIVLAWGLYLAVGWFLYLPIVACICLVGVPICDRAANAIGRKDPREVVFDEIATMPITFFLVPEFSLPIILAGFFLHRVFDILKPFGAYELQRLPGGWGIMADDVLASIYSCAAMQALIWTGVLDRLWGMTGL